MQALLRHLYLFVLLATGASLECEHCQGSSNVCSGPKEACPADKDICYTGYSEDTLEGTLAQNIVKGCESTDLCSLGPVHLHVSNDKYYNARYACCPWNNCNDVFPKLLPIKEEKKVVQCPACYSWTGECGSDVVNCTGKEIYCFSLTSKIITNGTSFVTMKGCTSKAVCETMKTGALAMIIKEVKEMRCTSLISKGSRLFGPLLPSFFGFLFEKIRL
nr:phospholipase A2 inhibitor subunit gamma B-like [Pogona vitticeps]XP_020634003.1 phospholipase A2 inhibitor subunit gamma B-like [Pogona vitticeps]